MAETVNPKRVAAGRKGAKVANKWHSAKERAQASKMSRKAAKKIPQKTRKRAAKKAAQTRKRRGI
jgi:hypothetical protein